jgi:hypothetical protein
LKRIAEACGLTDVQIRFSEHGRIPLTPLHYPRFVSRLRPRLFSDNVLIVGSKAT